MGAIKHASSGSESNLTTIIPVISIRSDTINTFPLVCRTAGTQIPHPCCSQNLRSTLCVPSPSLRSQTPPPTPSLVTPLEPPEEKVTRSAWKWLLAEKRWTTSAELYGKLKVNYSKTKLKKLSDNSLPRNNSFLNSFEEKRGKIIGSQFVTQQKLIH